MAEAAGAGLREMLQQVEAAAADTRAELARERVRSRSRAKERTPRGASSSRAASGTLEAGEGGPRRGASSSRAASGTLEAGEGGPRRGASSSRAASGTLEAGEGGPPRSATPSASSADASAHAPGDARHVPASPFASGGTFVRPSVGLPDDASERAAVLAGVDAEPVFPSCASAPARTSGHLGSGRGSGRSPNLACLSTAVHASLPHGLERRSLMGLHHARSDRDASSTFLVGEFARNLPAARERRAAAARAANGVSMGLGRRSSLADEFIELERQEEEARRATQA